MKCCLQLRREPNLGTRRSLVSLRPLRARAQVIGSSRRRHRTTSPGAVSAKGDSGENKCRIRTIRHIRARDGYRSITS